MLASSPDKRLIEGLRLMDGERLIDGTRLGRVRLTGRDVPVIEGRRLSGYMYKEEGKKRGMQRPEEMERRYEGEKVTGEVLDIK